jgi:hypothetical protein
MVNRAMDSLEREKREKERKMQEYRESVRRLQQEKDLQKQRENEQALREKDSYLRMVEDNKRVQNQKEENYKMFYQKVSDNQNVLRGIMNEEVAKKYQDKSQKQDAFINKNVEDYNQRKQQEERERIRRQLEAKQALSESHKGMINEREREAFVEKQGYYQKAEQVIKDSQDLQRYNDFLKRSKVDKQREYQDYLANQVKVKEDNMVKEILYLGNDEKKLLNSSISGAIGIKGNPIQTYSPKQVEGKNFNIPPQYQSYDAKPQRFLSHQPERSNSGSYNPITNPIPNMNHNPYMGKEQKNSPTRSNFFASLANSNMMH